MTRSALFVLVGLLVAAQPGCGGFKEAYETRVCWEDAGWGSVQPPAQCKQAWLVLECSQPVEFQVHPRRHAEVALATRVAEGVDSPRIGELFSQHCPPQCIPIHLAGGSGRETLHRDVRRILASSGFRLVEEGTEAAPVIDFDLELLDVRSDDPGWLSLRITTRARASFSASLLGRDEQPAWSRTFSGSAQVKHAYAALSDYQAALTEAYCAALSEFAGAVRKGVLEQPMSPSTGSSP